MTRVSGFGSFVILFMIAVAYMQLDPGVTATVNAGMVAKFVGVGILISLIIEYNNGVKNLWRADILAIIGIYVLVLFEFLFNQEALNRKISMVQAYGGLQLTLIGLFFLVLGRQLFTYRPQGVNRRITITNVRLLIKLYYMCFGLGFIYILIKVNFNPITMIEATMGPRFSQPWSRGRFGDWFVFLSELQLFTYAVPPLAGILFNYRKELGGARFVVIMILFLITLFMGFASGTRNVFFSYLIGFVGGYMLMKEKLSLRKLIVPGMITLTLAYAAGTYMLQFRSIGLTKFIDGYREKLIDEDLVYVDHNLYTLGLLKQSFPEKHDFLGTEVFVWALIKPVPRVLWPSKPEGLSVSMEEVAGVGEGYTLAATYIGESYMAGGIPVVIIVSLLFGYMAARWNVKAMGNMNNENLLIYALGLFAVGITMRSLFMFTTAILPIIGVSILLRYLNKNKATHIN
jgi:oligosaccharide repeat unit polymerase